RSRHTRFSRDWSSDVCSSDWSNTLTGLRSFTGGVTSHGAAGRDARRRGAERLADRTAERLADRHAADRTVSRETGDGSSASSSCSPATVLSFVMSTRSPGSGLVVGADDELAVADRAGAASLELGEVEADPHVLEHALAEVGSGHPGPRDLEAPARLIDQHEPVALGLHVEVDLVFHQEGV